MIVECHLRQFRGDRTLQELADQTGVSKGQLSQIEQGRSLPRDRDVPALERAYGKARAEWYPTDVAGVIEYEGTHDRALVSEVWMPRSGKIRSFALVIDALDSEDGRQLYSKGHHDQAAFMAAAQAYYSADIAQSGFGVDDFFELELDDFFELEPPLGFRHEWWATRVMGDMEGMGYSHFTNPVDATASGAYPVTVIDL